MKNRGYLFVFSCILMVACSQPVPSKKTKTAANKDFITREEERISKLSDEAIDTLSLNVDDPDHRKKVIEDLKILKYVLSSKSASKLENFVNRYEKRIRTANAWGLYREVCPYYEEGVLHYSRQMKTKNDPDISTVYGFTLRVIVKEDKIVLYDVLEQRIKMVDGDWQPYFQSLFSYKDQQDFEEFAQVFQRHYQAELNENELFVDYISFGESCVDGSGINKRKEIKDIEKIVAQKDRVSLLKWLQSANTEKQFYGVWGLARLRNEGILLNDSEMKLIRYILNKPGNVRVCKKNTMWTTKIRELKTEFNF